MVGATLPVRPARVALPLLALVLTAQPPSISPAAAAGGVSPRSVFDDGPPPIGFSYGGEPSEALLPRWEPWTTNWTESASSQLGARLRRRRTGFGAPDGLQGEVRETRYSDFPSAREWVFSFRQSGRNESLRLCNVSGLRLRLPPAAAPLLSSGGTGELHRFRGSAASASDYAPLVQRLAPGDATAFGPVMGRSSDHILPLFALATQRGGIVVSIGWSAAWQVDIERQHDGSTILDIWHGNNTPTYATPRPALRLVRRDFWAGAGMLGTGVLTPEQQRLGLMSPPSL